MAKKTMKKVTVKPKAEKKAKEEKKEMTRLGMALRTLGGIGGGTLGAYIGYPEVGAGLGTSLGATLSKWLGSGAYKVRSNTILTPDGSIPAMHNGGQSVVIRHKEYLGQITGSTTFSVVNSYTLNPGVQTSFPWLSTIAANFQEYKIKGMVFHYVPSSGDAVSSTNPALGTVMIQTSYRATDSAPSSKLEILNEYWASESVPSQPFCHPIECDPRENPFNIQYVRSGVLPSTENRLMYDLGVTHVAVQGQQTTGNPVGDLWVTYEVELKKPVLYSSISTTDESFIARCTGSVTTSDYWVGTQIKLGSMDVTLASTGKAITFPKGSYGTYGIILTINPATTFSACDTSAACTFTNCSASTDTNTVYEYNQVATSSTIYSFSKCLYVYIAEPTTQAVVTFGANTWTGTANNSKLSIFRVSASTLSP